MNSKDVDYAIDEAKEAIVSTVGERSRKIGILDILEEIRKIAKKDKGLAVLGVTSYGEEKHGTVFLDVNKGFIQVRDRYFRLKQALRGFSDKSLTTGHFTTCLGDAKNNMLPNEPITPRNLEHLINIEEKGLKNIPQVCQDRNGEWWLKGEHER